MQRSGSMCVCVAETQHIASIARLADLSSRVASSSTLTMCSGGRRHCVASHHGPSNPSALSRARRACLCGELDAREAITLPCSSRVLIVRFRLSRSNKECV